MKKIIFLCIILVGSFFVTGCGDIMSTAYKNMQISDKMNGYTMDLQVTGKGHYDYIRKSVRVINYKNSDYTIIVSNESGEIEAKYNIKGDKSYKLNGDVLEEYTDEVPYKNTNLYLDGLNNIKKKEQIESKKVSNEEYNSYSVTFNKNIVSKILEELKIDNVSVPDLVNGNIYLTGDNYVYEILYNLDDLTIDVNYYGLNQATELNI